MLSVSTLEAASASGAAGGGPSSAVPVERKLKALPILNQDEQRRAASNQRLLRQQTNGGIAVGVMGIFYVAKLQQKITFGKRGHAAIIDRSGNIIAHPNPKDWLISI